MLTELEVFQLSARACGYEVEPTALQSGHEVWVSGKDIADGTCLEWNPFTNAEQRWECLEELSKRGFTGNIWGTTCPLKEFPARALAELEARNDRSYTDWADKANWGD
jgi:hypothetical protein